MSTDDYRADVPDYLWQAVIKTADGEHDITRELAVMYDAIIGSTDWGSGFLDREDVEALFRVAAICGFDGGGEYDTGKYGFQVILEGADGSHLSALGRETGNYIREVLTPRGVTWRGSVYHPTGSGNCSLITLYAGIGTIGGPHPVRRWVIDPPAQVQEGKPFRMADLPESESQEVGE